MVSNIGSFPLTERSGLDPRAGLTQSSVRSDSGFDNTRELSGVRKPVALIAGNLANSPETVPGDSGSRIQFSGLGITDNCASLVSFDLYRFHREC